MTYSLHSSKPLKSNHCRGRFSNHRTDHLTLLANLFQANCSLQSNFSWIDVNAYPKSKTTVLITGHDRIWSSSILLSCQTVVYLLSHHIIRDADLGNKCTKHTLNTNSLYELPLEIARKTFHHSEEQWLPCRTCLVLYSRRKNKGFLNSFVKPYRLALFLLVRISPSTFSRRKWGKPICYSAHEGVRASH